MKWQNFFFVVVLCALVLSATKPSWAADTTEAFDVGLSNGELYSGYDTGATEMSMETLVGAGVTETFSLSLAHALAMGQGADLTGSVTEFGLFWNPVDTRHFDLDLIGSYGFGTPAVEISHTFSAGVELNLDGQKAGLYSRLFAELGKEGEEGEFEGGGVTLLGGRYFTSHWSELLLEATGEWSAAGLDTDIFALGFNMTPADWVEIIPEVAYAYTLAEEQHAFVATLGAIFTM